MALQHFTVSVTDTPRLLFRAGVSDDLTRIYITNLDANNHVFFGGPTVNSTNGYEITNQQATGVSYRAEFTLYGGEELYVVCAATKTATVSVIVSGA